VAAESLTDLQRFVVEALRGAAPVESNAGHAARASELLGPSARGMSPAARLEVYREQYWLRHLASLREDFPTVAWLVGEDAFRCMARDYLADHPPRTWNLQRLGAEMPAFLAAERSASEPLVVDASRLDWAFVEAFDAPDAGPLDLSAVVGAPEEAWASARLELHPSLRRLALGHAVHTLRDAIRAGRPGERPAPSPTHLVVWRDPAHASRACAIESDAFALLGELAAGQPLGAACEAVAHVARTPERSEGSGSVEARTPERSEGSGSVEARTPERSEGSGSVEARTPELGARVGAWFQEWTQRGWVSALRLEHRA
jgi:hypothetical protein